MCFSKSPEAPKKKGKAGTKWDDNISKADMMALDMSETKEDDAIVPTQAEVSCPFSFPVFFTLTVLLE